MNLYNRPFLLLLILIALFSINKAHADSVQSCDLASITEQLNDQPTLNRFTQTKHISILSKPLTSQGFLLISEPNNGVVWQTLAPIRSTIVISDKELRQFNKLDEPVTAPASSNQKASQLISSTFLAILAGNLSQLEENFRSQIECSSQQWHIVLQANNSDMQHLIDSIIIQGQSSIEHLTFTEANGDRTELTFTAVDNADTAQQLGQYFVP